MMGLSAVGEVIETAFFWSFNNNTVSNIPPELIAPFSRLANILQVAGIVIIAYVIFLIIGWILNIRRNMRINIMYHKVNELNSKMDLLIEENKKAKKEMEKIKKIDEKETKVKSFGFISRFFSKKRK